MSCALFVGEARGTEYAPIFESDPRPQGSVACSETHPHPMLVANLKKIPLAVRLNAAVKARMQERRAERSLSFYRAQAAEKGIVVPDERSLTAALRLKLSKRPHPPWPKPKGSLHVFMPYYLENWEFVLPQSMASFGRVTHFDWREIGYKPRADDWLEKS